MGQHEAGREGRAWSGRRITLVARRRASCGLRGPQPVLRAAKALRKVPIGGTLVLECTDPLSVIDVPHFVNQTGQALTAQEQRGSLYVYRILKQR